MTRRTALSFALASAVFMIGACAERAAGPGPAETTGAESATTSPSPTFTPDSSAPATSGVFAPITPEGPLPTPVPPQ